MCNKIDVIDIIQQFSTLYPNYHPADIAETADAWLAIVEHVPGDMLKAAALQCSAEPGRAFAPSVGEIMGAVAQLQAKAASLPDAITAWAQINERPSWRAFRCPVAIDLMERYIHPGANVRAILADYGDHLRGCTACHEGTVLPNVHPFVERVARSFGWPERFPGDNPEADRAHFVRVYEQSVKSALAEAAQIPAVTQYIERISAGSAIKSLAEGMKK